MDKANDCYINTNDNFILLILLVYGLAIRLFMIIAFRGIGWEPDTYFHTIHCASVFEDFPHNVLRAFEVQPKPLFTLIGGFLIKITGQYNIHVLQIMNACLWTLNGWIIYLLLQKLHISLKSRYFALAIFFTCYLGLAYSIAAVTETMFVSLVLIAVLLWFKNKPVLAAFALGVSIWVRLEAGVLILAFSLLLLFTKRIKTKTKIISIFLLWLPVILWNLIGYLHSGEIFYLITSGYSLESTPPYNISNLFHYVVALLKIEPILMICGFLLGIFFVLKNKRSNWFIIIFIPSLILVSLSILYWSKPHGPVGRLRNIVVVIPFMAMLLAYSTENSAKKLKYIFIIVIPILLLGQISHTAYLFSLVGKWEYFVQISPNPNRDLLDAGKWIKDNFHSYTIVACPYPAGLYAAGRTFKYGRLSTNLDNPGLLIWDPNCPPLGVYGLPPSNPLGDLELIKKFRTSAHVYLFTKKTAPTIQNKTLDNFQDAG